MDLRHIPALDQHAHNLLKPEAVEAGSYAEAFTESNDLAGFQHHARQTLFFRRSLRDIASLLECEASEEAILSRRRELGIEKLAALCFQAAHLSAVFLDDGFLPQEILPWDWHRQFLPVRRILRLEYLAETLIPSAGSFDAFLENFLNCIDPPPAEVVAFKSIAAYRSGLRISEAPQEAVRSSFEAIRRKAREKPQRLVDKAFIDFIVPLALDVAARHGIPVQFHTGLGDPDMDLRLGNPLHLRPLLEDPRRRKAPIVLLHAGYPFVREAGYLASVYPRVFVDLGLAIPFLSVEGMRNLVRQLMELAPTTKLLFSSDARMIPELYYLGAKWGRKVLADVLDEAIRDSDLTAREAETVAERVLNGNARRLYLQERPL